MRRCSGTSAAADMGIRLGRSPGHAILDETESGLKRKACLRCSECSVLCSSLRNPVAKGKKKETVVCTAGAPP
jgi:hypothetical protein